MSNPASGRNEAAERLRTMLDRFQFDGRTAVEVHADLDAALATERAIGAGIDVERLRTATTNAIAAATEDGPDLSDLIAAEYARLAPQPGEPTLAEAQPMSLYAVTKDVPITVYVEAEDEDAAREVADFRPVWDKLYGKATPAVDAALHGIAIVGFPYDDTEVEERDIEDVPEGMAIQRGTYVPGGQA